MATQHVTTSLIKSIFNLKAGELLASKVGCFRNLAVYVIWDKITR